MGRIKARDTILLICYFLFTSMFIYAAASKLMNYRIFIIQMDRQPFPDKYTHLLVWSVLSSEILSAVMMMTFSLRRIGLFFATTLMICFTAYIILVKLNYYGVIPCSCGGVIASFTWTQHLIFNLFFIVIGIVGIYLEQQFSKKMA
ncbi:MauE/DoxX family redox-associated membrane protein [Chitinophaga sp. CF418]|uniref:MauE/DoxX family redox-associated membrane protein n=1 Tax=Chitinophaga sp. CF418 TaxID=1855287 RepID=UPI00122CD0BE|nr:MauE/DoxX family redox-associated membrane protein [Chitinophaga sp. CF418]